MTTNPSIFKADTAYNAIFIDTDEHFWTLRTADQDLQSRINRRNPEQLTLKNLRYLMGILLFLPAPESICLLGTGGGGLIHFLRHHYPASRINAVEIDGELLEIMHREMALPEADERLTYIIDDALHYIDNCRDQFDLIIIDLFLGNRSPSWLLKAGSMQKLYAMLNRQGGLSYNLVIDSETDFNEFYASLKRSFHQQTLCLPVEDLDNTVAFAFRQPPVECDMASYMAIAYELGTRQDINYMEILSAIYGTNPTGPGVI